MFAEASSGSPFNSREVCSSPILTRDLLPFDRETALLEDILDVVCGCLIGRRPNGPAPDLDSQVFHVLQRTIALLFSNVTPGWSQGHRVSPSLSLRNCLLPGLHGI